jgi:hypothetical protein
VNVEAERRRLSQTDLLAALRREIPLTDLVTVYQTREEGRSGHSIYCALIPNAEVESSLGDPSWDLQHGGGMPGANGYRGKDGKGKVDYLRYGELRCEPLVIDREFHGVRPNYVEITEEFRHFHRLYHDRKTDQFIKITADGNEHVVATIEPGLVRIRLKEIRQFLAIKEMHLAILFDCQERSSASRADLGLKENGADERDRLCCWGLNYGDIGGLGSTRAFSRLLGKRLIPPLPKEKSGFWGFADDEPEKHVEFIIGVNEHGEEVLHTCDPDAVGNYFGANPGAPHYLTPVHFKKQVLDKYYLQASRYRVSDATLWCGTLWRMDLDNHHDDKVCAWLGDLGRDLPYEEQLHWRSHNIAPVGSMSETFVNRQLNCVATDSDRPEHVFHQRYHDLAEACTEKLGWRMLLPLASEDEHHFQCLRVPSTDEQKDFDDLVLSLTKLLVDSLNEKELNRLRPTEQAEDVKGSISRLEAACKARGVPHFEPHIEFLRKLQNLRSAGSAHRKGSNYQKIAEEFKVDSQSLRTVFGGIMRKALEALDFLIGVARSGAFAPPTAKANA